MPQYDHLPHGLILGHDNTFFFTDADGVLRDTFQALLRFRPYQTTQYCWGTMGLRTPAEQLCLKRSTRPHPHIPHTTTLQYAPTPWFSRLLDAQAPGWGMVPPSETTNAKPLVFFHTHAHALAVVEIITSALQGIPTAITTMD